MKIFTFHSDVDALVFKDLWLYENMAGILPLIQLLLHIQQLQCTVVFKRSLPVVEWKQVGVLVPFDGVVRVTNNMAVDVRVSSGYGCEVFHGSDIGRTLKDTTEKYLSLTLRSLEFLSSHSSVILLLDGYGIRFHLI